MYKCPNCGNTDLFTVVARSTITIKCEGASMKIHKHYDDYEFGMDDTMVCESCKKDFLEQDCIDISHQY